MTIAKRIKQTPFISKFFLAVALGSLVVGTCLLGWLGIYMEIDFPKESKR